MRGKKHKFQFNIDMRKSLKLSDNLNLYCRIYGQWDPGPILDDDMRTCEQRQDCTDCKGPIICAALGMIVIIAFVIALIVDDLRERGLAGFSMHFDTLIVPYND